MVVTADPEARELMRSNRTPGASRPERRDGPRHYQVCSHNRWPRRGIWTRISKVRHAILRDSVYADRQHDREAQPCGQRGIRGAQDQAIGIILAVGRHEIHASRRTVRGEPLNLAVTGRQVQRHSTSGPVPFLYPRACHSPSRLTKPNDSETRSASRCRDEAPCSVIHERRS